LFLNSVLNWLMCWNFFFRYATLHQKKRIFYKLWTSFWFSYSKVTLINYL